jgi:hypothetical protein
VGHFCPPGSGSGFQIRIRIQNTVVLAKTSLQISCETLPFKYRKGYKNPLAPEKERKIKGNKDQLRGWLRGLPLVEPLLLGVALEPLVLDNEAHALVERGGEGGRLLPQQDVNGGGHGVTELRALAGG